MAKSKKHVDTKKFLSPVPPPKHKTITLGYGDNPVVSLCPGHVPVKVFNVAYKNEGWVSDPIKAHDLSHEWWKERMFGKWEQSEESDTDAVPVTVYRW